MLLSLLTATALASEAPPPTASFSTPLSAAPTPAPSSDRLPGPATLLSTRPPQLSGWSARSHELAVAGALGGILGYAGVTSLWIGAIATDGTGLLAAFATVPVALLGPPAVLAAGLMTLPPALRMRREGVDLVPGFGVGSLAASLVGAGMVYTGWTADERFLMPGVAVLASAPILVLAQCFQTARRGHLAASSSARLQLGVVPVSGGAMASLGVRF